MSVFCSFSLLYSFLLYEYITIHLSILMLIHSLALFAHQGLLQITYCMSLGRPEHSQDKGAYQEWICWTIMYDSTLIISRCHPNFLKCLCYFCSHQQRTIPSFFINTWYALFILAILVRWMMSHCFNVHFPDDQWCRVSLLCLLLTSCGKNSLQWSACSNLCPALWWDNGIFNSFVEVLYLFYLEVSFWNYVLKIFSASLWLPFHSLNFVFWWTKVLNFNEVQFISLFFHGYCSLSLV